MKKMIYVASTVAAAITASTLLATNIAGWNYNGSVSASNASGCLPSNTDSLANAKFVIKKPADNALPFGYKLQAVDDATYNVMLYYADHPICKPTEISRELSNGTLVVQIGYNSEMTDGQQMAETNAKGVSNATNGKVTPQIININGHKAIVIPEHMGVDRTTLDGKVIHEEPLQMPAAVLLFNSSEKTQYYVTAHLPAGELVKVAQSIQ
ncbi:MAG: hypothetical protein ABI347_09060 [Nitrososphaera sp.]|jgi:hypothetical protein